MSTTTTATILRVARSSRPGRVARAILGEIERHGRAEVRALGAGAVYQAVKALAIARRVAGRSGADLVVVPGLVDIQEEDRTKTVVRFQVFPRRRRVQKVDSPRGKVGAETAEGGD